MLVGRKRKDWEAEYTTEHGEPEELPEAPPAAPMPPGDGWQPFE